VVMWTVQQLGTRFRHRLRLDDVQVDRDAYNWSSAQADKPIGLYGCEDFRERFQLHYEITYWIEHTYNRSRRQRRLGRLTPVEFELAFTTSTQAAA